MLEEQDPKGRRREGASAVAGRPRWWAVLAVSLALMALVASLTSGSPGTPRTGAAAGAVTDHRPSGGARATPGRRWADGATNAVLPPAGSSTATDAGVPRSGSQRPTAPGTAGTTTTSGARPTAPRSAHEAQPVATPPATTTPTATTAATAPKATTPTTTTTTTTTTTVPGASTRSEVGNLTYPDNVTALYSFPGPGPLEAVATWSGASELMLSVACAGRTATRTGASGLSVSVPQGAPGTAGTCTVTIAEPTGVRAEVSYSLDVGDGPGSGS